MAPAWTIHTGRLILTPVGWQDIGELCALKADPRVYAMMLGGVRTPIQVAAEMAEDNQFWARHGAGMWMVRTLDGAMAGLTGVHQRVDGRGIAIRFAFRPETQGKGMAREAAGAALRFAHERAHIPRIVAVCRENNIGSRTVLGAIGLRECDEFMRDGHRMLMFESVRSVAPSTAR